MPTDRVVYLQIAFLSASRAKWERDTMKEETHHTIDVDSILPDPVLLVVRVLALEVLLAHGARPRGHLGVSRLKDEL